MKSIFISLALMLASLLSYAQWISTNGPPGSTHVDALATDGTHIFAGTPEGVYLSTDDGNSWMGVNTGFYGTRAMFFAFKDTIVFAVTYDGNVFSSANYGESWMSVSNGLPITPISGMVVSDSSIFLATWNYGIYRSTDNGSSWQTKNNGIYTSHKVQTVAVIDSTIFAGTTGGVYRSTDNGETWIHVITGMVNTNITLLGVCGTNLYAVAYGKGIYRSADNGDLWTEFNEGLNNLDISSFATRGSSLLFIGTHSGGVYRSSIYSDSWRQVNLGLANTDIWALAATSRVWLAGTGSDGVYLSPSTGGNWSKAVNGFPLAIVTSLVVQDDNIFVATWEWGESQTTGSIFLSDDNGSTWTENIELGATPLALVIGGPNIFVGTFGNGVFRSTNGGSSWDQVNDGLTTLTVVALAAEGEKIVAATNPTGLFISFDGGGYWTSIESDLFNAVSTIEIKGNTIFVGTGVEGLFRSDDNGITWTSININIGLGWISELALFSENIYAAAVIGGGVYVSGDNGNSWELSNNGLEDVQVYSFAFSGNNIIVGTSNGVYWSTDNGNSWVETNEGFPNIKNEYHGAIVAIKDNMVIASYGYQGVFINNSLLTSSDEASSNFPQISIYPNPADQAIILETSEFVTGGMLTLYNVSGQQVFRHKISERQTTIDIHSLPNGLYFVQYESDYTIQTGRFVKE